MTPLKAYPRSVIFYAVISDEIEQVIETARPRRLRQLLEQVLRDEPERRDLVTGRLNYELPGLNRLVELVDQSMEGFRDVLRERVSRPVAQ